MVMIIHKNAIEVEMANPDDDDSTFTTTSELLDTSIEDVRNNKETMFSKIESVTNLMKRVEFEEKAAEQAREDAFQVRFNNMLKMKELKHKQQHVKEKKEILAREACEQKKLLSVKMEALQLNVTCLKDNGDRSLELLDEMGRSLEMRLNSALVRKKVSINNKKVVEASARAAFAYQEAQTTKVEEESERLKQEAVEMSKLQELLIDREHLVTTLHKEISDKCQEVKRLKKELDQGVKILCSRKSSISASSSSLPCQPQTEPADSDVLFKNGDFIDDHVQSANCKQMKRVADIARSIKNVKIKGKLHANQMFAKCIKKVKIKGKLHGNKMFANHIKKIKIKNKVHRNQICGKRIKKLKIKVKRQHGNQMRAKSIKTLKMQNKRRGSQGRAKSVKKVKIKYKLNGSQLCSNSVKKVNVNGKQQGCQMCAINIKKVKIKGLQVVQKRRAIKDY